MKYFSLYFGIAVALVTSCSVLEEDFKNFEPNKGVFYASFERPDNDGTRVYANEQLLLRWNADDRVSIFNNISQNEEYRFVGENGDSTGEFNKVDRSGSDTGAAIPDIVSVYPYREETAISADEVLTLKLPAEQKYARQSFGLGANTMVSVSSDNNLEFKTVGGYLRFRFYGESAHVTSITLQGNNGEKLAGTATVAMPLGGVPSLSLDETDASSEITMVCEKATLLGQSAEESTDFWFVLPPVTFSSGFTVTVTGNGGSVFTKSTDKTVTIERNKISTMAALEVTLPHPDNVIYYTSQDNTVITPLMNDFSASLVRNEYADGLGIMTFDGAVTKVGQLTFTNKALTSVSLPESVTVIGQQAFGQCESLSSISLPGNVTLIDNSAFVKCISLTSIKLPERLTQIGLAAFSMCSGLTSISLPESLVVIDQSAFNGCSGLTSVSFPESVTTLGQNAFGGCSGLTSVTIPKNIVSIGLCSFVDCPGIESIVVDADNPSYDSRNNCNAIIETATNNLIQACKNTVIPESVTSIDMGAFGGITELTSLFIPGGVTRLDPKFCLYVPGLESITVAADNPVYDSRDNCNAIIETATNTLVVGCRNTVIPSSVSVIGNYAFYNCSALPEIAIPQSVTTIGDYAFQGCSGLTEIAIPESVTSIGQYAFCACIGLKSVSLPANLTVIPAGMFSGCSSLTTIALPQSVTSIERAAFSSCPALESIILPEGLTNLGSGVFQNCTSLTEISIPQGVTTLDYTFSYCSALKSVSLPEKLTTLGGSTFAGCSSLVSLSLPESLSVIGLMTFSDCTSLTSLSIPDNVSSIGYAAFQNCTSLTSITLPSALSSIDQSLFMNCTSLKSVTIPEPVFSIGYSAFANCTSLTSITIPKNVNQMFYSFNGCTNLKTVTMLPTNPPQAWGAFGDTNDTISSIYVPADCVNAYKSASYWSNFADRIFASGAPATPVPEAIDLGLPSGIKWASFNIGASKPEEYGDHYAWGETEPYYSSQDPLTWNEGKEAGYDWPSYKWCMGEYDTMTKYCSNSSSGYSGFTDNKTVLDPEDDVAYANLGGKWRMPTDEEFTELSNNCTWEWTSMNGINGRKVTGPNGNSIFFPAAGGCFESSLNDAGSYGYYWSSSLRTDYSKYGWSVNFNSSYVMRNYDYRCYGLSVRPVSE